MKDKHGDYGLSPYPFSQFRVMKDTRFDTVATHHGTAIILHNSYNGTKAVIADGLAFDVAVELVRVMNDVAEQKRVEGQERL